ncbi:UDP-N-acetylmuramoyl-L-alanine--D-glutamate ligase [Candidatus Uhrbacteria bacterium]|nr:UDP-N-acetylmuramoyl-L-alanine--D-glutamate ligase [Candidatus Uhrbacteria bacterium]
MDVAGKKVVIMGLGLHGGGLAVAKWMYAHGARVVMSDVKSKEQLQASLQKLANYCQTFGENNPDADMFPIEYGLGGHHTSHFDGADMVIQNPGVPRESEFLQYARSHGSAIENEASLFFLLTPDITTIAVTGTRGKSTTAALLFDMIRRWKPDSVLGGGIATARGTIGSLFDILDPVRERRNHGKDFTVVLELSSWQLEFFPLHKSHPKLAIITNVMNDHMNRYPSMESYVAAKGNIGRFQTPSESLILNHDNYYTRSLAENPMNGQQYWFSRTGKFFDKGCMLDENLNAIFKDGHESTVICSLKNRLLQGDHNIENILAAVTGAVIEGVPKTAIQQAIDEFAGVPGRFEYIGEMEGRTIVNDTASTTPDATIAALKILQTRQERQAIILIAGGADKNLDFAQMAREIKGSVQTMILLAGTATPKLVGCLKDVGFEGTIEMANSMEKAVDVAWKHTSKGDILVLSPGAASFGMFAHEFDRGEKFVQAIERIRGNV